MNWDSFPTVNFVRTFKDRQFSAAVLSFALMLRLFLTVIMSDVYSVESCAAVKNIPVTAVDYLTMSGNATASSTSADNDAGFDFALLNLRNLPTPNIQRGSSQPIHSNLFRMHTHVGFGRFVGPLHGNLASPFG